jgi:hypothetical protein
VRHVYPFRFDARYRLAALPFGITPESARVTVEDDWLEVQFGPWRLESPLANVTSVQMTGPFRFVKTAGPPHLSFVDRGITFATNGDRGVCVAFRKPVPAMEPTGRLRHPGVTVTVADPAGLADLLMSQAEVLASDAWV